MKSNFKFWSVVSYTCETWSPTLREEYRFIAFANRAPNKTFRHKRVKVEKGGEKKLHNEELHNLNHSPNIIRVIKPGRMRWVGNLTRMMEKRNAYRV